jgi:hypothetical protein
VRVDTAFEVAVAGENAADIEIARLDRFRDVVRQRTGVTDAGRAAVTDEIEAETSRSF